MAFDATSWSLPLSQAVFDLLNDNFERMLEFVDPKNDEKRFRSWVPDPAEVSKDHFEFLRGLRIPVRKNLNMPDLLLHELGSYAAHPDMKTRINNVFREGNITCFVNTSGSGKTRHVLEGLCLNWGFYLCLKDKTEDIGSVDMNSVKERVELKKNYFTTQLPPDHDPTFQTKLEENRDLARASFSHVILARLLVFRMFLTAIAYSGRAPVADDKRRWTLLQINPSFLGCRDIFDELASIIDSPTVTARQHPSSVREVEFKQTSTAIIQAVTDPKLLPRDERPSESEVTGNLGSNSQTFYFVLDEAQIAANEMRSAFRSGALDREGKYIHRPLLREFLVVLHGLVLLWNHGVVITGTGLDIKLIEEATNSVILKKDMRNSMLKTDTGGFYDRQAEHVAYIKKYIPPDVLEDFPWLLERMTTWLFGRYRLTASLIIHLLESGFQNPSDELDNWIMYNTRFIPSDSQNPHISFPCDVKVHSNTLMTELNFVKITREQRTRRIFEHLVYESFVRSSAMCTVQGDSRRLVECGFARFDVKHFSLTTSCIFEPLILLAAIAYMETDPYSPSTSSLVSRQLLAYTELNIGIQNGSQSNGFENYVALVLANALGELAPLQEIFSFHTQHQPAWIGQRARLVSVHASGPDSEPVKRSYEVNWPKNRLPSGHLGHTCNVKETLDWLKHKDRLRAAFCFPDNHMGPDIMFKLELEDGSFVWVVVQCKNYQNKQTQIRNGLPKDAAMETLGAIKTVTPSKFWLNKNGGSHSPKAHEHLLKETAAALADFSDSDMQAAPSLEEDAFRLIRVLAFFPPKMAYEAMESEVEDIGRHPIAAINWDYLKMYDEEHFMEDWENQYDQAHNIGTQGKAKANKPRPISLRRSSRNRKRGATTTTGKRKAPSSSVKHTAKSSKRPRRGGEDEDMRRASESRSPWASLTPRPDRDRDVSMATAASRAGTDIEMGDE
ncbi:hypothetical protein C8F01DRAFT_1246271 [Mycena amicta]|nr:hypothetical protein C8F01DRAFT_1246271 [Mycena amicta]